MRLVTSVLPRRRQKIVRDTWDLIDLKLGAYLLIPRVLGDAVGLSPLLVLVSVAAVAILFGGFAVRSRSRSRRCWRRWWR